MNQSAARRNLVEDLGPAQCPRCQLRVNFSTDSNGYAIERCECGYSGYVHVRMAVAIPVVPPAIPLPA
jgi:hypothetical protein